jgi:hypothetical protein
LERKIETPEFIYSEFVEDITLSDRISEFFHSHPYLHTDGGVKNVSGEIELFGDPDVPCDIKRSREIVIYGSLSSFPVFAELNFQIQKVLNKYVKIYPRCNAIDRFYLQPYQIQTYKPNEGYLEWHCETPCGEQPYVSRVLTFMMNCNTSDGGTEFLHQDFISTSEKGKLTIFPADWTFTHRGLPASKEKMIVTGWWNFEQV